MNFTEQQSLFPTQSVDEFLAKNLLPEQKKIIEFLRINYGEGAEKIYKSAMYVYLIDNIPAKQMIVIHCFNELINLITREPINTFKKSFEKVINEFDFWESEYGDKGNVQGMISSISKEAFEPLEKRITEIFKLSYITRKHNPLLSDDERKEIVEKIHEIKEEAPKSRHAGDDLFEDNNYFQNAVNEFNKFLQILAKDRTYIEKFNYIMNLKNIKAGKVRKNDIKNICDHIDGNLINIFFSKLENPEWFNDLNEKKLLSYSKVTENGREFYSWPAIPYLTKIIGKKNNDIFINIIQPVLNDMEKNANINFWVILNILNLAMKMPDKQFIEVLDKFNNWIELKEYVDWFNEEEILAILDRASKVNKNLTKKIIKQLLTLHLLIEEKNIRLDGKNHKYFDTEIIAKLGVERIAVGYLYAKILKIIKNISTISQFELFNIFCETYIEMFKKLTQEQIKLCQYDYNFSRSCIEYHQQDGLKQDTAIYKLISAIRDSAMNVLENGNEKEIEEVFTTLDKNDYPIFKRIILHLLRISNHYKKILLEKYILDYDLFNGSVYIYEYFHLIQDKFNELSNETKNKIFNYIEEGPKEKWYQEDGNGDLTSKLKIEHWKWHKLQPIKNFLTKEQKELVCNILSNEKFKDEHPDFNSYLYSDENHSPIEKDKIKGMSAEELIKYLKQYEPSNNPSTHFKIDELAFDLQTDVKENPSKYINVLDGFKLIKPSYIYRLFSGLKECGKKTNKDWIKITKFGQWVVEQNAEDWQEIKREFARLLSDFFLGKEKNKSIDVKFLNTSFEIFKFLSLEKDNYLNKKSKERNYYSSAINSMHGAALEGLIYYGIWMKNNNKTIKITTVFDRLLVNGKYLETWAVFGKLITWINYIEPEWTKKNIDKIFPINDKNKFNAAWIAHICYGRPSKKLFSLLKDKFEYVLNNNIYKEDETETEREKIAQDISSYYAWGEIKLKDDIMKNIFLKSELSLELKSLIKCIGLSLRKGKDEKIVNKFVKLWAELLKNIKGNEKNYKDTLEEFGLWYGNEIFDREWVVDQLHKLIINFKIRINVFYIKKSLMQDLPNYTKKIFEIVREMALSEYSVQTHYLVEPIVKYITEDSNEDKTLKSEKNDFINKFLESVKYDVEGWARKLEPYAKEQPQ